MRFASIVMLCAAALLAATAHGCYAPDQPVCTYRCDTSADNNGHCPWDYECRADGYCHLKGSTGMCPFTAPDLSVVDMRVVDMSVPPDLSVAPDMSVSPDLAMPDLASAD